ncbi:hypothetical protein CMV_019824 [Castanea mollissima]|uniref:Uncharacterized protein n=1 Tax=Castanea mollissima TaxID=60419 RepID=A0A8J4QXP2_9ROSI|nr:hypothetical protein CMV_019824 [Castanea mollissima]
MNSRISPLITFLLLFFFPGFQSTNNTVTDTILPGQSLTHPKTIESPNGIFELCFFSPGNSTKYYLGIRFKNVSEQSVVWVANRKYPFPDSTAVLNINRDGDLVISDGTMTYAMTNTSAGNGTYAMLLDTVVPIIMKGSEVYWLSLRTSFDVLSYDSDYVTWPFNYTSQTQISRILLDESGKLKLQSWLEDQKKWNSSIQSSRCEDYALCGNFSVCNETARKPCSCLPGFKPVSGDVSSDCVRKTALQCSNNNSDTQNDKFLLMSKVDWLDYPKPLKMSSDKECQSSCLNNCSCIAYAFGAKNGSIRSDESDCIEWHDSFSNLKLTPIEDKHGNGFYLKLAPSESVPHDPSSRNESNLAATPRATDERAKQLVAILAISLPLATFLLSLFVYCVWKKLRMTSKGNESQANTNRIVGTYGYMSPEYALEGLFSIKNANRLNGVGIASKSRPILGGVGVAAGNYGVGKRGTRGLGSVVCWKRGGGNLLLRRQQRQRESLFVVVVVVSVNV